MTERVRTMAVPLAQGGVAIGFHKGDQCGHPIVPSLHWEPCLRPHLVLFPAPHDGEQRVQQGKAVGPCALMCRQVGKDTEWLLGAGA